ncbi:hypothetical protein [Desulfonatronospira sp.]|uniref:hypothetical protein n=1 Tax=Desulfonatronospira sp. TaxID=1962951 RepID=UPI0025BEBE3E|nr:hypothetical protein [Desulfonatronospira sp.]
MNHKGAKDTKFRTGRRVFFENRATVFKKAAFSFAVYPANEKTFLPSFATFAS